MSKLTARSLKKNVYQLGYGLYNEVEEQLIRTKLAKQFFAEELRGRLDLKSPSATEANGSGKQRAAITVKKIAEVVALRLKDAVSKFGDIQEECWAEYVEIYY